MSNPQIIPAILAKTEQEYKEILEKLESSNLFINGWIHIDFTADSVGPEVVDKYPTSFKKEAHLMIPDPGLKNMDRVIQYGIYPEDDLPDLSQIDFLLIMGVHPGKQGQLFLPETLDKVSKAARLREENNLNFTIEVDGGVSADNAQQIFAAGADRLVIGSHLTKGDIDENFRKIQNAARQ